MDENAIHESAELERAEAGSQAEVETLAASIDFAELRKCLPFPHPWLEGDEPKPF